MGWYVYRNELEQEVNMKGPFVPGGARAFSRKLTPTQAHAVLFVAVAAYHYRKAITEQSQFPDEIREAAADLDHMLSVAYTALRA